MKLSPLRSFWKTNMETYTIEHDGLSYTILCGKNAKSNDALLDETNPDDVWFHVAGSPSGHVFLKNTENVPLKKLPKQVVTRCACICKSTIKASNKCQIIYTLRKHVEKTNVLGQVVPSNCKQLIV